ncbi:hypothetical protein [Cytobacillus gottheilii]|uniref:Group-specific protein n=1 Tax=Cytobacillus gottheilii TaxID=859144 RepID=A0ABX8FDH9_9BACI|nr:hypothetical protein [Cytobacillus gottheilii]QVY62230.1 hypothetical protein J1899_03740 [Cytobacillus gottheilii]
MKKQTVAVLLCILFAIAIPINTNAASPAKNVEIYNVDKREVTSTITPNAKIQNQAEKMIKQITGVYKKLDPLPKTGYMVKIPLQPSVSVNNQWLNGYIDELIIIIPDEQSSHILVFDDENNPHFFTCKNDQQPPLELFNLK